MAADMQNTDRNAAIWFAADAFDPEAKGLNGRRVAGESFLRGYLKHADIDELRCCVHGTNAQMDFAKFAEPFQKSRPIKPSFLSQPKSFRDIGTVFFPSPTFNVETWRRYSIGQTAFSICGVTHTTATQRVMNGMFDLLSSPVEPWDGVICTSQSVFDQINYQMDVFDEYQLRRGGIKNRNRPNTTVIPLGIHTDDFKTSKAVREKFRTDHNIGDDDVCYLVISRLSAHEKFDPLPLYMALQKAAVQTKRKLNLILCGYFPDDTSQSVFQDAAPHIMPDVGFYVLNGKSADARRTAFSAADVFVFPIDNVQETFGLAPIEGLAAGLPVICSDWDGMKDTITPDVGIRVKTRFPGPRQLPLESLRFRLNTDSYRQHITLLSQMTQIDVDALSHAILDLADNPDKRKRMGQAGRDRARMLYDWSVVVPQMQDYWQELGAIRRAASHDMHTRYLDVDVPTSPNAGNFFRSYPTEQTGLAHKTLCAQVGASKAKLETIYKVRRLDKMNRAVQSFDEISKVLESVINSGHATVGEIGVALNLHPLRVERSLLVLLKYDLLFVKEDRGEL